MTELTREDLVAEIGEENVLKIEYAIAHPEESVRRPRPRRTLDEEPPVV